MNVRKVFAAICCVAAAGSAFGADMSLLYEKTSASLKNGEDRNEFFGGTDLMKSDFMGKLEDLYYVSAYENSSEYSDSLSLNTEELDGRIIKELQSVDFEEIIKNVKADTKVTPLPKTMGGGKLAGMRVRRWLETSRKAEAEIKAKREVLSELKRDFSFLEKNYPSLKSELKAKVYIYIKYAVKSINLGNYESAKKITDLLSERYYKVRYTSL